MAKLPDTAQTAIAIAFLVMNLSKMFRQIFWFFLVNLARSQLLGGGELRKVIDG
jgi:hypothetical protein